MKPVDAVIFDFGKVLGSFDKMPACRQFAESSPYSAAQIYDIIVNNLERRFESGQMSASAFAREMMHAIKADITVDDVRRIWGNIFSPNPAIEPFVDELIDRKMRLGVLSNTNDIHWLYISDLPVMRQLKRYGATFTLSYKIRAFKPDRVMYMTACKSLGVEPERALYLDDIEEYVQAARTFGLNAERYDCTKDPQKRLGEIFASYALLEPA